LIWMALAGAELVVQQEEALACFAARLKWARAARQQK